MIAAGDGRIVKAKKEPGCFSTAGSVDLHVSQHARIDVEEHGSVYPTPRYSLSCRLSCSFLVGRLAVS